MYLSLLQIKNFRCFDGNEHSITFKKGLNVVLCQDLKQIKMRIFHRKINICSLSCIYTII